MIPWLVIGAIALWCVAVSLGAMATWLDDAVRLHTLRWSAMELHRRARRQALGLDGWDVDVLDDDDMIEPAAPAPPADRAPARRAA